MGKAVVIFPPTRIELFNQVLARFGVKPIKGRPGATLPKAHFGNTRKELEAKTHHEVTDEDILSYLLYPQVFTDFRSRLALDGYGFHQAYLHPRRYVASHGQPTHLPWPGGDSPRWTEASESEALADSQQGLNLGLAISKVGL